MIKDIRKYNEYELLRSHLLVLKEKYFVHEYFYNGKKEHYESWITFDQHFAYYVQYVTQHSMIIDIAKLLDKGKNRITLKHLFNDRLLQDDKRKELNTKLNNLILKSKKVIDYRNNVLAHAGGKLIEGYEYFDNTTIKEINEIIIQIEELFYEYEKEKYNFRDPIKLMPIKESLQNIIEKINTIKP